MAITFIKALPALVGSRNDNWIKVSLSSGNQLVVKFYYTGTLITTQRMPKDAAGTVSFNIKRIIQSMGLFPNLLDADIPAFDQGIITACSSSVKVFSITLSEIDSVTGDEIASQTINSTVLLAGLNPEQAFSMPLVAYLSGPPRKFLTNKPLTKLTGKNTQEYLYYYNSNVDFQDAVLQYVFRIYYTDGSDSGEIVFSSQVIIGVILPAGYNQLNIGSITPMNKQVFYWEVYIKDSGVDTEKHRYEIDERCHPTGREFLFLNSLGGMDTLRINTVEEVNLDRQSEVVERYVSADTALISGQYYETEIQTNRKFKAATSQLLAEERLWLQEFFASSKIFEISDGKFLPVRILTGSVLIKNKADYLDVKFEYRYRYDDIGYTKP